MVKTVFSSMSILPYCVSPNTILRKDHGGGKKGIQVWSQTLVCLSRWGKRVMMTSYKSKRRYFIRVPGVCQCVRDEGEPLRGNSIHGGQQQDGGQPGPGGRAHIRLERQAAGRHLIFRQWLYYLPRIGWLWPFDLLLVMTWDLRVKSFELRVKKYEFREKS